MIFKTRREEPRSGLPSARLDNGENMNGTPIDTRPQCNPVNIKDSVAELFSVEPFTPSNCMQR